MGHGPAPQSPCGYSCRHEYAQICKQPQYPQNTTVFAAVVRYREKRSDLSWLIDALRHGSVAHAAVLDKGATSTGVHDASMQAVLKAAPAGKMTLVATKNEGRESTSYISFLANLTLRPAWQQHDLLLLAQASPWHLYMPRTSCLANWLATLSHNTACVSCFGVRRDAHEHMTAQRGLCVRSRFFCEDVPLSRSITLGLDTFCAGGTVAVSTSLARAVSDSVLGGLLGELRSDVRMEFYMERSWGRLFGGCASMPSCERTGPWARPLVPMRPVSDRARPDFVRADAYRLKAASFAFKQCEHGGHHVEDLTRLYPLAANSSQTYKPMG